MIPVRASKNIATGDCILPTVLTGAFRIAVLYARQRCSGDRTAGGTHGLPPQRGWIKFFDGDWLTSYDHPDADGNWYGMAFDKPVVIDRVRCVPVRT